YTIVTCKIRIDPIRLPHGPFLPSEALSRRPHPRRDRRALDDPHPARPAAAGPAALSGLPGVPRRGRAKHALRAAEGHVSAGADWPPALQRSSTETRVPPHRKREEPRAGP